MQFIVYLLAYPLLWIISKLPFTLLYFFSDIVYLLVYRLIGYRKKTVRNNIAIAFPEKSQTERLSIEKKFYSHMCDMFLEMIKTMSISENEMDKRFQFTNLADFKAVEAQGRSIVLFSGHYASYEWVLSLNSKIKHTGFAIYKRIANPHFDQLVRKIRGRFNAELIHTKETVQVITENENNGNLGIYGFATDQTPRPKSAHLWMNFLNKEVPVYTGGEFLAKKFDMNVVFLHVRKVRRGHYVSTFEIVEQPARTYSDYEITERYMRSLEALIREAPEYYLWTHKRFKYAKN